MTRLSPELAAEIRAARAAGASFRALGERYGIAPSHAKAICDGRVWREAPTLEERVAALEERVAALEQGKDYAAAVAAEARRGDGG